MKKKESYEITGPNERYIIFLLYGPIDQAVALQRRLKQHLKHYEASWVSLLEDAHASSQLQDAHEETTKRHHLITGLLIHLALQLKKRQHKDMLCLKKSPNSGKVCYMPKGHEGPCALNTPTGIEYF